MYRKTGLKSNKNAISDKCALEEGRNNYFDGMGYNAALAPGRCIMGKKEGARDSHLRF